jgi:hypothetical protein
MKAKMAVALFIIIGTLGLTGCKPKTTTLTGQVFIVMQGGENIKLGDVEILLIEKAQVAAYLARKEPVVDAEIASAQQEFDVAKENSKEAYVTHKAVPQESTEQAWFAADDQLKAVMKKLDDAQGAKEYFSDFLPDAVQKTVSDADGKFSFTYLRDKPSTIYAMARRTVPDEFIDGIGNRHNISGIEEYYWLVDAPTNSETTQIFLSNDNLVFVDPDGYFKVAPKQMPTDLEFGRTYNHLLGSGLLSISII